MRFGKRGRYRFNLRLGIREGRFCRFHLIRTRAKHDLDCMADIVEDDQFIHLQKPAAWNDAWRTRFWIRQSLKLANSLIAYKPHNPTKETWQARKLCDFQRTVDLTQSLKGSRRAIAMVGFEDNLGINAHERVAPPCFATLHALE